MNFESITPPTSPRGEGISSSLGQQHIGIGASQNPRTKGYNPLLLSSNVNAYVRRGNIQTESTVPSSEVIESTNHNVARHLEIIKERNLTLDQKDSTKNYPGGFPQIANDILSLAEYIEANSNNIKHLNAELIKELYVLMDAIAKDPIYKENDKFLSVLVDLVYLAHIVKKNHILSTDYTIDVIKDKVEQDMRNDGQIYLDSQPTNNPMDNLLRGNFTAIKNWQTRTIAPKEERDKAFQNEFYRESNKSLLTSTNDLGLNENNTLRDSIKRLKSENAKYRKLNSELQKKLSESEQQANQIKSGKSHDILMTEKLQQELENTRKELKNVNSKTEKLDQTLKKAEEDNKQLKHDLNELKEKNDKTIAEQKNKIEETENAKTKAELDNSSLKKELAENNRKLTAATENEQKAKEDFSSSFEAQNQLSKENSEVKETNKSLQNELEKLKEQNAKQTESAISDKEIIQKLKQELEDNNKTNTSSHHNLKKENSLLKENEIGQAKKIQDQAKQLEETTTELNTAKELNQQLTSKTLNLQSINTEVTTKNQNLAEASSKKDQQLSAQEKEINKLKEQLETLKKEQQQSQETSENITKNLNTQLLEADAQAKKALDDQTDLSRQNKILNEELNSTKNEMQLAKSKFQETQESSTQQAENTIKRFQEKNKQLTEENKRLQEEVNEKNKNQFELVSTTDHKTKQLNDELSKTNIEKDKLLQENQSLQKTLLDQQAEFSNQSQAIREEEHAAAQKFVDEAIITFQSSQQALIAEKDQEIEQLKNQNKALNEKELELQEQKSINNTLRNQLQEEQQNIEHTNQEYINTIQAQQAQLQRQEVELQHLAGLQSQLDETNQQIITFNQQLEELKSQTEEQVQVLNNELNSQNLTHQTELQNRDQSIATFKNSFATFALEQSKKFFVLGDYESALNLIDNALVIQEHIDTEQTRNLRLNKLAVLIGSGQYQDAINLANALIELEYLDDNQKAIIYYNMASAYNGLGSYTQALDTIKRVEGMIIERPATQALLFSETARALIELGEHQQALEILITASNLLIEDPETKANIFANTALALNGLSRYLEAFNLTSQALSELKVDKKAKAELLLQQASALNSLGKYHEAGNKATEGLTSLGELNIPNLNGELMLTQAQAHYNLGHNNDAINALNNLLNLAANGPILINDEVKAACYSLVSNVLSTQEQTEDSLAAAQEGLNLTTISNFTRANLFADISSALIKANPDDAVKAITTALNLPDLKDNQKAALLSHLSEIYFQHSRYAEAAQYAQQGLQLAQTNARKATLAYDLSRALININPEEAFRIATEGLTLEGITDNQKGNLIQMQAMALTHDPYDGLTKATQAIISGINTLGITDPAVKADLYVSLGQQFNAMNNQNAYELALIAAGQGLSIENIDPLSRASLAYVLAEAYLGLKRLGEAVSAAQNGLNTGSTDSTINLQLYIVAVDALKQQNLNQEAINVAIEGMQKFPNGDATLLKELQQLVHG